MKIAKSKKSYKKPLTAVAVVALLGAAAYGLYASYPRTDEKVADQPSQSETINQSESSDEAADSNTVTTPDSDTIRSSDNADKTPPKYEGPSADKSSTLTGVINYKSVSDDALTIRMTINQRIDSGSCTLTLTSQSTKKTVKKTATVIPNPSSATCKGFSVPVSELGPGVWNIKIDLTDGKKSGQINDQVTL